MKFRCIIHFWRTAAESTHNTMMTSFISVIFMRTHLHIFKEIIMCESDGIIHLKMKPVISFDQTLAYLT